MVKSVLSLTTSEVAEEGHILRSAWISNGQKTPPSMTVIEGNCKASNIFRDSGILKALATKRGQFGTRPSFIINFGGFTSYNCITATLELKAFT